MCEWGLDRRHSVGITNWELLSLEERKGLVVIIWLHDELLVPWRGWQLDLAAGGVTARSLVQGFGLETVPVCTVAWIDVHRTSFNAEERRLCPAWGMHPNCMSTPRHRRMRRPTQYCRVVSASHSMWCDRLVIRRPAPGLDSIRVISDPGTREYSSRASTERTLLSHSLAESSDLHPKPPPSALQKCSQKSSRNGRTVITSPKQRPKQGSSPGPGRHFRQQNANPQTDASGRHAITGVHALGVRCVDVASITSPERREEKTRRRGRV